MADVVCRGAKVHFEEGDLAKATLLKPKYEAQCPGSKFFGMRQIVLKFYSAVLVGEFETLPVFFRP